MPGENKTSDNCGKKMWGKDFISNITIKITVQLQGIKDGGIRRQGRNLLLRTQKKKIQQI